MSDIRKIYLVVLVTCVFAAPAWSLDPRTFVLDMLKALSPDGYYIVDTYTNEAYKPTDFMEYFDSTSEYTIMASFDTIVHEISHGYMAMEQSHSTYFFVSRDESIRVPHTAVFRTSEIAGEFPDELRTFRFCYVDTDSPNLGAQVEGVYGLLDEMNAYYLGCKTSYDLYLYYLEEGPEADWQQFFTNINGTLYGIAEFKLYILKYIMYAHEHYPEIYRGIVQNSDFRRAFKSIDENAYSFIAGYFCTKAGLLSDLRREGYAVEEDERYLSIGKDDNLQRNGHFLDTYNVVAEELAKPEYTALVKYLAGGEGRPAYPYAEIPGASELHVADKASHEEDVYLSKYGAGIPRLEPPSEQNDIAAARARPNTPPGNEPVAPTAATVPSETRSVDEVRVVTFSPSNPGDEVHFTDPKGDVDLSFADIISARVRMYGNAIEFSISFDSIPEKLIFNDPRVKSDNLEYSWGLEVDLQGDGRSDYAISVDSFKFGDTSPIESTLLKYTQKSVWELTADGGNLTEVPLLVDKRGNTLVFLLQDNSTLPLSAFTAASRYRFKSYVNEGESTYSDSL